MEDFKTLNIFGTWYRIRWVPEGDPELEGNAGTCDFWSKEIVLSDGANLDPQPREAYKKENIRHEILHACLYESGLGFNSHEVKAWAVDEEMVDWWAIQGPKVFQIWKEAGCL